MAITSADIHNQSFSIDRKGYDVDEVDVFLEHVADEIDLLNERIQDLEIQLQQANAADAERQAVPTEATTTEFNAEKESLELVIADRDTRIAELEQQLEDKRADDNAIAQALIIAQRSADEILVKANSQATDTIQEAREEAQRIIDRANIDRQNVIDNIRKLQDDREEAREEYSDMLKDIISDASRKLAAIGGATFSAPQAMFESDMAPAAPDGAYVEEYAAVEYTTPQATDAVVAAATPVAAPYEKDLSGFGDADDSFEFEEID